MYDCNNVKLEPHFKLQFGKGGKKGQGGDGGQVILMTENLSGEGRITTDGGDGEIGGKGGHVYIDAKENKFKGGISAKGGRSVKC